LVHVNSGVSKAVALGRKAFLMLGVASLTTVAVAQTVPDQEVPSSAGLDLPANLQIFGKANPNIRKPTAIVNDTVITGTDVDHRVALVIGMNKLQLKPEEIDQLRLAMVRQLIDETLQIQEAKSNKITVEPKEIETSFARVGARLGHTPEQFRAWLKRIGASERTIRRQIEGELAWGRLLRNRVDVNVSEAEAKEIIDRITRQKGSDEYRVYEIYMGATPDRSNEVYTGMQRMIQQMREGVPFDYLAKTYSEASTKSVGGDLGWVRPAMLPDPLAQAAQDMRPGQVAGPIQLPTGFSILYLAEKRKLGEANPLDAKLSLKQVTITFPKGPTQAQASGRVSEFATATQAIRGCGDVAKVAAAQNATSVDNDGMSPRQLPAALQNIVLGLQVGQATQPFGSVEEGVSVLVLCGRDDPRAPGVPTVEQLQDSLAEQRVNIRATRMLRDLRRDALIEYR
jgi:peptidyl-prolyl cis-trans isomerase SurA